MKFPNPKNIGNHLPSGADMKRWAGNIPHPKAATWNRWGNSAADKWNWMTTAEHWKHGGNRTLRVLGGLAFLATTGATLGLAIPISRALMGAIEESKDIDASAPHKNKASWSLAYAAQLERSAATASTARDRKRFSKEADKRRDEARTGRIAAVGLLALGHIGYGVRPFDLTAHPRGAERAADIVMDANDEVDRHQEAADLGRLTYPPV